jgi:hypothetical protein
LRSTHFIIAESLLNMIVSTLESPSFWQNMMQYRCSTCSVIIGRNAMRQACITAPHTLAA